MKTINILGNNFASLILANKLAEKKIKVRLFLDGQRAGGHFAGIKQENCLFDIGMTFLEKPSTTKNIDKNFTQFAPNRHYDWVRYGELVAREVDEIFSPILAQVPKVVYDNQLFSDYLIANDMELMRYFDIKLANNPQKYRHMMHAKFKNKNKEFRTIDFETASIFNNGYDIHNLMIMPFLKKITKVNPNKFEAKFHRVLWVPLFWPETIHDFLKFGKVKLENYKFFSPSNGTIAEVVRLLEENLRKMKNVEVLDSAIENATYEYGEFSMYCDNREYHVTLDSIGTSLDRFCALFKLKKPQILDREDLVFGFFLVDRKYAHLLDFSVLNVVDSAYKVYRVSNQGICKVSGHVKLCLEGNLDLLTNYGDEVPLEEKFLDEFTKIFKLPYESVSKKTVVEAMNTLKLPTFSNIKAYEQKVKEIHNTFCVETLTGGLLGYNLTSLNDQIAQALKQYHQIYHTLRVNK